MVQGNVGGTSNHLEGIPEDIGGTEDAYSPLESIPMVAEDPSNIVGNIPDELHSFTDVFTEDKVMELPPHHPYDLEIVLQDESCPVQGPVYPLRPSANEELKQLLKDQLDKGLIRPSRSKYSSPVLFVPKKNGKRRMAIDYCALTANTVKNAYPLPLIQNLIEKL